MTMLDATVRTDVGTVRLDVELRVDAPATVAVLGPNGAGKTTLLRVLAGLHPPGESRIVVDGQVLDDPATGRHVPTEARPVGMVFQDRALFPHLSAVDNVAFGLRARGRSRPAARAEALEWLSRVGLEGRHAALPGELSGGEAQRVALARALATEPRLLLLDEPTAALDASVRAATRRLLARALSGGDGIRVLVTHDPLEAMALADHVVVLDHGSVVQQGDPSALAAAPRNDYVAELVGVNLLRGHVEVPGTVTIDGAHPLAVATPAATEAGAVWVVMHPRTIVVHRAEPAGSARNVWRGEVRSIDDEGDRWRVRVELGAYDPAVVVVAEVTRAAVDELRLRERGTAWLACKATEVTVFAR
jgi:molybdate transport system ATP-binding protein